MKDYLFNTASGMAKSAFGKSIDSPYLLLNMLFYIFAFATLFNISLPGNIYLYISNWIIQNQTIIRSIVAVFRVSLGLSVFVFLVEAILNTIFSKAMLHENEVINITKICYKVLFYLNSALILATGAFMSIFNLPVLTSPGAGLSMAGFYFSMIYAAMHLRIFQTAIKLLVHRDEITENWNFFRKRTRWELAINILGIVLCLRGEFLMAIPR